jgi:hypothetical protein
MVFEEMQKGKGEMQYQVCAYRKMMDGTDSHSEQEIDGH